MSDEREAAAEELRRVREAARTRAGEARATEAVLPAPKAARAPEPVPGDPEPPPPEPPARPDQRPVNAGWDVSGALPGGILGRLARRLLAPLLRAQGRFNAHQVQLDNELLDYVDARLAHTHRHYDAVLGIHGRHMQDIDQRHLQLQEDLVGHVHDLVKRIDLVLAEGERSRVSLEFALCDLRARLERLEQRLGRDRE